MDVIQIAIGKLKRPEKNVRIHTEAQIAEFRRSIEMFGQIRPIVIDEEYTILAGNGLHETLVSMGAKTASCYIARGLSPSQKKKLMLADNRVFSLGQDDTESIEEFLKDLDGDLDIPGFDDAFLSDFLNSESALSDNSYEDSEYGGGRERSAPTPKKAYTPVTEHDVEEEAASTRCKPGQIWKLGGCRLLCGDSTDPGNIERLMQGKTARMVFTDPPWNIAYGKNTIPGHKSRQILNDDLGGEFPKFMDAWMKAVMPVFSGDLYCVMGAKEWPTIDHALRENGMHWSATIIWSKNSFVIGRANYHRRYEPIWYGWKNSSTSSYCGRRDLDDVWDIPRPVRSDEHPTMKPIALVARAVENSSNRGDIVIDPFGGSGSTLIACEQLGRDCYTVELSPHYCDVILHRWETLTGRTAELAD